MCSVCHVSLLYTNRIVYRRKTREALHHVSPDQVHTVSVAVGASRYEVTSTAFSYESVTAAIQDKSVGDVALHRSIGTAFLYKSMGTASLHKSMGIYYVPALCKFKSIRCHTHVQVKGAASFASQKVLHHCRVVHVSGFWLYTLGGAPSTPKEMVLCSCSSQLRLCASLWAQTRTLSLEQECYA